MRHSCYNIFNIIYLCRERLSPSRLSVVYSYFRGDRHRFKSAEGAGGSTVRLSAKHRSGGFPKNAIFNFGRLAAHPIKYVTKNFKGGY